MNLFSPLPQWPFGDLKPHYYNLIVVDYPWLFKTYSDEGLEKSAQAQYECLNLDEIQALPIGDLADVDCLLLCWAIAPLLREALDTIRIQGFTYKSFIHWTKVTKNGKPAIGTGYRVRSMGEICLVAAKGNPQHDAFPGNFSGVRREHSRKPEEFYQIVEAKCPDLRRRADIFSRQSRSGWENWGKESTKFDTVAA